MTVNETEQEISARKLDELGREIFQLREERRKLNELIKEPTEKLAALTQKMLTHLEILEKKTLTIDGAGRITRVGKFSYQVPHGEDLKAFLAALTPEQRDALLSIKSAALNEFMDREIENAVQRGLEEPVYPGIGEGKLYFTLSAVASKK